MRTGKGCTSGVGKSESTTTEETQPHVNALVAASSAGRERVLKALRIRLMFPARSAGLPRFTRTLSPLAAGRKPAGALRNAAVPLGRGPSGSPASKRLARADRD